MARRNAPITLEQIRILADASCQGADPSLFDNTHYREALESGALALCAGCAIPKICLEIVRPNRTWFDGVAGGHVWRNGHRVRADNTTREDRQAQGIA